MMNLFGFGSAAEGGVKRSALPGQSLEMLKESGKEQLKKGSQAMPTIGQGHGGLVVVDCPGYGYGSRAVWGSVAMKYLEERKQYVDISFSWFLLLRVWTDNVIT